MASPMYFTKVSWELWCVMRFLNYLNTILVEYVNFLADRVLLGSSFSLSSSVLMLEEDERTTYPSRTSQFFARVFLGWSSSSRSSVLLCLRLARKRPIPAERLTFLPNHPIPAERLNFLPDFHLVRVLLGWSSSLFSSVLMLEEDERTTYPGRTS